MASLLTLLIIIGLMLGPVGHLALTWSFTPNLLVVFLWAVAWFRSREEALRLAIVGGIIIDLAGFNYFGLWTLASAIIVLAIVGVKSRYLDSASLTHSILALTGVSFIPLILIAIFSRNLPGVEILLAVLGNVILGIIIYYLLAMRGSLFLRWTGRRIG